MKKHMADKFLNFLTSSQRGLGGEGSVYLSLGTFPKFYIFHRLPNEYYYAFKWLFLLQMQTQLCNAGSP